LVDEGSYRLGDHPRAADPTAAFGDTDVQLDDHLDRQENLEPTLTFWNPLFWWIQRHEPNVRDKFMPWKSHVSTRKRHSNSLAPIRTTDQF
jgi:hypothetical protein